MKRTILLLPLLFLLMFPQPQLAQTITPVPTTVDYTLPYPGLLPDNPLYSLKVLRDRIISFFISDPLKRSSFDVLQADKRLQGAFYLQKKGNSEDTLVGSTLSKAVNYFDSAIREAKLAKSMGEDANPQLDTIHTALLKHSQIITQMMTGASPTLQRELQLQASRIANLEKVLIGVSKQ